MMNTNPEQLISRIKEVTGWPNVSQPRIVTDTSDCMSIQRGNVVKLGEHYFVIEGNRYETRFGIGDQPKYWVFGAIDLETGKHKIIKTVFHEDFHVHIGVFKVRCYRSPEKEAKVLQVVKNDRRFMQGYTVNDTQNNNVRVIDFIRGPTIFQHVYNISKGHEQYYHEDLPGILRKLIDCMEAIQFLHDRGTCHGDIRNDHIIIDSDTGYYRWIDFDLNQNVSDFDVWSMGNILNYIIGKGINSFQQVLKNDHFEERIRKSLRPDDGSAFYEYRIMNLQKLYPYISTDLNNILLHFAIKPRGIYSAIRELIGDFRDALEASFPTA
ncbi:MAG: serine/threonine protein kinase [FCB group bacterium]|nr:serine/threonine protein kinase [FCB group bacterium]